MELNEVSKLFERIEDEIGRVFVGQDAVLNSVLIAMLARGHVLLEGVPGVGKTLLVRTLGRVLGCHFRRVQFTPDLMPSDVTGSTLYNSQKGTFEFKHGPVFTHILLADEVNRAPAKTQSAMLESMAERSVTVDGVTHPLPEPYFVLATQNPLESAGTYALPEAQLDRFLFKLLIEHPSQDVEEQLLRNVRDGFDAADLEAANLKETVSVEQFRGMQTAVESVQVDDKIVSYIAQLVGNTRRHRAVQIGASPRAAIALLKTGRVEAAVQGRTFVIPDDIKTHGKAVLRHRLILQPDAEIEGVTTDEVIDAVLRETQVPGMGEQRGQPRGIMGGAPFPAMAPPPGAMNPAMPGGPMPHPNAPGLMPGTPPPGTAMPGGTMSGAPMPNPSTFSSGVLPTPSAYGAPAPGQGAYGQPGPNPGPSAYGMNAPGPTALGRSGAFGAASPAAAGAPGSFGASPSHGGPSGAFGAPPAGSGPSMAPPDVQGDPSGTMPRPPRGMSAGLPSGAMRAGQPSGAMSAGQPSRATGRAGRDGGLPVPSASGAGGQAEPADALPPGASALSAGPDRPPPDRPPPDRPPPDRPPPDRPPPPRSPVWADPAAGPESAPAPSGPARPDTAPSGSSPARPAGLDPDTLPPPTRGPFGNRGGQ